MPKHFRIVIGSASFLAIGAPLLVQPASATTEPVTEAVDAPVTPAERGEIVVTAQRRSENIQDVGMSLTALDDTKIARMVVANATDLTAQIPNLRFTSLGTSSVVVYNIRGVSQNDFLDHLEPPIAVYQDDAYLSTVTQAGVPVFDVQRAEVLRGPQGTLFGRNATGGLIHFISNQPTDTPDGYVDLTFADDLWGKVEGAVGGPLGPTLSARVAATTSSREGYGENASGGRKLGADHYVAGRMILAFRPVEDIQADLTLRYIKNFDGTGSPFHFSPTIPDADGLGRFVRPTENPYNTCNGCGPAFYEGYLQKKPYKGSYSTAGHYEREVFGATIKLSKDFGALQLESITDYQHLTKDTYEDSDATPLPIATNAHTQKLDHFTQELRLIGETGRLKWTTGSYFFLQDTSTSTEYELFGGLINPLSLADLKTRSISFFGQGEFALTDKLSFTLGGRYTKDKKEIAFLVTDPASGLPDFFMDKATRPDLAKKTFNLYSARAEINWRPTSRMTVYASYNRGTKGGGFGLPGFLPVRAETIPFKAEVLHSYEFGQKWTSDDGRIRLNTSFFYYDYKDYQGFSFQDLIGSILNQDAVVKGVEAEISLRPTKGLTLDVTAAGLDTRVKDVQLPGGRIVDRDLPLSPSFSGTASARYEFAVLGDHVGAIQMNVTHSGASSLTLLGAETEQEGAYTFGDLRVSLGSGDESWEASVFVKNLWNERYRVFAFDESSLGTIAQAYNRPRTIGVTFRHRLF